MRGDDERHYPPGVVPGAVGALGALAVAVLVLGVLFGALLVFCDHQEPVQMIPHPAAVATASAQVVATQSVRVTVRRPAASTLQVKGAAVARLGDDQRPNLQGTESKPDDQGEEIVIEVTQAIAATSSAQASASVVSPGAPVASDHGRLGVIAAYPIGLAADLQLVRVDVPPWLVGMPLEVSADAEANNLQAGAGLTVGGKAFAVGGLWSRWDLGDRGYFLGAGLRF